MAGLLTHPRHTVQLIHYITAVAPDGSETRQALAPVSVRCNVHPKSATEAQEYGSVLTDSYTLTAPAGTWPGAEGDTVLWDGLTLVQRGRTIRHVMSAGTRRDTVHLEAGNG